LVIFELVSFKTGGSTGFFYAQKSRMSNLRAIFYEVDQGQTQKYLNETSLKFIPMQTSEHKSNLLSVPIV
jgi:hypothetical protein